MIWLYDLIFIIFIIFSLPFYLWRKKFHQGILLRMGFFPQDLEERLKRGNNLWVHAVSVGEVNAVSHLIERLQQEFKGQNIVISTVTATGNRLAKAIAPQKDLVVYLPFDLSFITRRFVEKINPSLFITTETELWPNLITSLSKRQVPIILVNGRISLGSFRGYRMVKYLLKDILGSIRLFCMQSASDAKRIISLGADKNLVRVTGNMKFDLDLSLADNLASDYSQKLKSFLRADDQLIIAGSTHPGEEEIILRVYQELSRQFAHLRLLIAPRHIERAGEVEKIVKRWGFDSLLLSKLDSASGTNPNCIFILDTIGQLRRLYNLAAIVFVGGSLIKKGGHNIIEPAFFGKPVIVGPFMFNFKDIADAFLRNDAIIRVADEIELLEEMKILLLSPSKREAMARRCQETIKENRGATEQTFRLIKPLLD